MVTQRETKQFPGGVELWEILFKKIPTNEAC